MLSSMIRGEIIAYLDTGKVLAKDVEDEDIMFARPGPPVECWERRELAFATLSINRAAETSLR